MARRLTTNQEIAGSIPASINIISSKEHFIFGYLPSCISKFVFGLCLKYYLDIAKKKNWPKRAVDRWPESSNNSKQASPNAGISLLRSQGNDIGTLATMTRRRRRVVGKVTTRTQDSPCLQNQQLQSDPREQIPGQAQAAANREIQVQVSMHSSHHFSRTTYSRRLLFGPPCPLPYSASMLSVLGLCSLYGPFPSTSTSASSQSDCFPREITVSDFSSRCCWTRAYSCCKRSRDGLSLNARASLLLRLSCVAISVSSREERWAERPLRRSSSLCDGACAKPSSSRVRAE
jgi:hypothetical protein